MLEAKAAQQQRIKIEKIHEDSVVSSDELPTEQCDFTIIQKSFPSRLPDWKEIDRLPIVEGSKKIVVFLQVLKDKTRGAKPQDHWTQLPEEYAVFHLIGTQDGLNSNSTWEIQQETRLWNLFEMN